MTEQAHSLPAFDSLVLGAVATLGEIRDTVAQVQIGHLRSSPVFEALKRLEDCGFVVCQSGHWSLLDAGRFALARETGV